MNYKIDGAIKKSRISIIIALILWLFLAIVLIMPFTCSMFQLELLKQNNSSADKLNEFIRIFVWGISNLKSGFKSIIKYKLFFFFF